MLRFVFYVNFKETLAKTLTGELYYIILRFFQVLLLYNKNTTGTYCAPVVFTYFYLLLHGLLYLKKVLARFRKHTSRSNLAAYLI